MNQYLVISGVGRVLQKVLMSRAQNWTLARAKIYKYIISRAVVEGTRLLSDLYK